MVKPKSITAIDVGSSKVVTLIGQVSESSERINIVGASSIPSAGVRKGQIVNIEEAADTIIKSVEAAERMAGFSISKVVVSIGGAHILSQNSHGVVAVSQPQSEIIPDDVKRVIEAARAISLPSSREIIHVTPRYFNVDSQEGVADPVGMSGVRLEVETNIITGSSTSIKNLTKCVSEVGAGISGLVFSGLASAEAVLTETEKELGVILLDFGGGTTSLVIYVDGSASYVSVLPVGAKNVTNDLAIGLRLSLDSAEKLKLALSEEVPQKIKTPNLMANLKGDEEKTEKVNEDDLDLARLGIFDEVKKVSKKTLTEGIIRPRLNEIFNMVAVEIQKSGFGGMTPSGIVLAGGGAMIAGTLESCKRSLSLPVRIGVPSNITGLIDDVVSPAYATSVGLLIYGLKQDLAGDFGSSLPNFGKITGKIPLKGIFSRILSFLKSLLP